MQFFRPLLATVACTVALSAQAQIKWDLPAAYPATNFHTENLVQFAKDVEAATGGKLKITVHPNGSLFKANEIKRAVQGGQAQIGEILLVNLENENAIYGADGVPFLAVSYDEAKKLAAAQRPLLDKLLGAQGGSGRGWTWTCARPSPPPYWATRTRCAGSPSVPSSVSRRSSPARWTSCPATPPGA